MTVVVGYVPTQTGFSAVTEAERQARCRGVAVVIVNVVSTAGYVAPTAADDKELEAVTALLTSHGMANSLRHVVDAAPPADIILGIAQEVQATLIVLGLHHRSWIAKRLLGSTAQSVVLGATCPVLVVPDVDARENRSPSQGIEAQPLRFMGQIPT
jgi:nucleotide-binding universal stress UspA family protein